MFKAFRKNRNVGCDEFCHFGHVDGAIFVTFFSLQSFITHVREEDIGSADGIGEGDNGTYHILKDWIFYSFVVWERC
jgi:hypothetical protein